MLSAPPLPADVLATLNPNIARTVAWLRDLGYETCDSGDGQTHLAACDRPYPYVCMKCPPDLLVQSAMELRETLRGLGVPVVSVTAAFAAGERPSGVCIQASYDPIDGYALLDLMGLDDNGPPSE